MRLIFTLMDLKNFLKLDSNKILLVVYLFIVLFLLGFSKITYLSDTMCDLLGECRNVKSPAFGIPPLYFYSALFAGGDSGGNLASFSWTFLIINVLILYIVACVISLKL